MKSALFVMAGLFFLSPAHSQSLLDSYNRNTTYTPDECFDIIKTVWDGLKKISEEYHSQVAEKSEFESTAEFNARVQKSRDRYVTSIRKFASDHALAEKLFSVWLTAELKKYDADKQVYGITSPDKILVQPRKNDIAVTCPENKYVNIVEANEKGYRSAYLELKTNPEFSWYVNRATAQSAKEKEQNISFKFSFTIGVQYDMANDRIDVRIVPHALALMDRSENFTYWSESFQ